MEILRNIEKNVIDIVNSNNAINLEPLNKNINIYFEYISNKEDIDNKKRDIYIENYENKRIAQDIEYDNYLKEKKDLKGLLQSEKTKTALHNYLRLKHPKYTNDLNVHTYHNIVLKKEKAIKDQLVSPYKPTKPTKPTKPAKICPEGKEVNPVTGNCVNKCKVDEFRNVETGKCNKNKAIKKVVKKQEVKQEENQEVKKEENQEVKQEEKQEVKQDKCSEDKKKECEEKGKKCNPDSGRCIKK